MSRGSALTPQSPGPLLRIGNDMLAVDIAASAGGRLAQITCHGVPWLIGPEHGDGAMIAWGSYPMLPWAGRIRRGRFRFHGTDYQLPINLGDHAIHGVAFGMPWQVDEHTADAIELFLRLPKDERWPFGGSARQRIEVDGSRLRMQLSVSADEQAMPVALGWHPWFHKPERLEFSPTHMFPRDADGIATPPLIPPPAGPWDDCFINTLPVVLHRQGQRLRLTSDCRHWVVYDGPEHATCVEPQSGPPDAFNLAVHTLAPGETLSAWYEMEWLAGE